MTKQTDIAIITTALEQSRKVLGTYIEPGARDPKATVEALLAILDDKDVIHALNRVSDRRSLRLVEIE